jgi:hypothetical protein
VVGSFEFHGIMPLPSQSPWGYNFCTMLKILAMLALLFLGLPNQAHAQTNKAESGIPSGKISPVAIQEEVDSPKLEPEDNKHVDANVKIISTSDKDAFDKATLIVGVILALVGIAGVGVGIHTLRYLGKQTAEMSLQRDAMVKSLAVQEAEFFQWIDRRVGDYKRPLCTVA